jgi:hypothetical protein
MSVAETSELITHAVLQLVVVRKTAFSEIILQGAKNRWKSEGAKSGLYRWIRKRKFKVQTSAGKIIANVF